ncbi:3D domain-containing protein [Lysinibacillus sp. SGAir0095]|uniref:3D domain-containing protein n=1 Tax=Lysinibacillus sp. SGAir0095 TaxID=2070463 RepID=UPI0010CCC574|nr:3D domain-containing protein [Lysinibacillus sp. SGAir0095]QCR32763.1 peptidoglycan-binding protein [Lysinibacillus sp. SGAir0095]
MKTKLSMMMLLIVFTITITTNVYGMEIDRAAMHTDAEGEGIIITDQLDGGIFDDALDRSVVFYKQMQPEVYQVQEGDNLFRIAINHQVELEDLMKWNDLSNYTIHPGMELVLYENGSEKEEAATVVANASSTSQSQNVEKQALKKQSTKTESSQPKVVQSSSEEPASGRELLVTATAYTAYCEGCSGTTAIGIDLRSNPNQKVIAVDPNVIPLGSKVWVEGYGEAIAGDTGGAIKGNKIDVFIPTRNEALQWGRKQVKLKILN